jgi:uncharacterized membrane protein
MFGRNGAKEAVAEAASELSSYGSAIEDEKVRQRLVAALTAGLAARQRAKRQTGMLGVARRLAEDPVLRAQAMEAFVQLQKARRRIDRRRSHKVRTSVLLLAGFGAVSAAVAVPTIRERVLRLVGGVKDKVGSAAPSTSPTTITEEIEVDAPLSTVYNQWTQFEEFPQFMEGVEEVRQLDDTRLHWVAKVAGKRAEWDAKILYQEPDRRIGWQSIDGKQTTGTVTFTAAGASRTRIRLVMTYTPEGVLEQAGSAVGLDERRVRGDLQRFKELIEQQGTETGAWRGEIKGGQTTSSSEFGVT